MRQVLDLVNKEREDAGLAPLTLDPLLEKDAMVRSAECVVKFSHTRPDGTRYRTAIEETGLTVTMTGENCATGHKTPEQVVNSWMKSEGHRANILRPEYTRIGIGLTENTGNKCKGFSWTLEFSDEPAA